MNDIELMKKIELIKIKIEELKRFERELSNDSVKEFEKIKLEISDILNEKQRVRFSQIEFYTEREEYIQESDEVPF